MLRVQLATQALPWPSDQWPQKIEHLTHVVTGMTVSIITVVRNDRDGLAQTIASVRLQSCSTLEFIVIDGDSNDGTVDVIRANADIIDYWESRPDAGIYDAMNKGLNRATGEFVLFLNAGDCFLSATSLELAIRMIDKNSTVDLLYLRAIGENGHLASGFERASALQFDSVGNHQAVLVRLAAHRRFPFDTRYRIKADRDVQLRMYLDGCRIEKVPVAITRFRGGGISATAIGTKEWENIQICWRNRVGLRGTLTAACLAIMRVSLHTIVQNLGLNWDSAKAAIYTARRPHARRRLDDTYRSGFGSNTSDVAVFNAY